MGLAGSPKHSSPASPESTFLTVGLLWVLLNALGFGDVCASPAKLAFLLLPHTGVFPQVVSSCSAGWKCCQSPQRLALGGQQLHGKLGACALPRPSGPLVWFQPESPAVLRVRRFLPDHRGTPVAASFRSLWPAPATLPVAVFT